jgi:hypothetical protein
MAEDHQAELDQMAADHDDRMDEINRQEFEKLEDLKTDFDAEMVEINYQNESRKTAEETFFKKSLERWGDFFDDWLELEDAKRKKAFEEKGITLPGLQPTPFQEGGWVGRTGLATVHQGEYVLNPNTTRTLRDMMGGQFTQAGLLSMAAGGGSNSTSKSVTVTFHPGAIAINESSRPGMTAVELQKMLVNIFEEN